MKFDLPVLLVTVALSSAGASAALLNVNNLSSIIPDGAEESLILLDNAGNPLSSGFASLYTFAGPAPNDFFTLQSVGTTGELARVPFSPANNPGPGAFTDVLPTANDGSLNGLNLYLVIGTGGTDVQTADGLAMIDTGLAFTSADGPGSEQALNFFIDSQSIIVLGSLVDNASADWSFGNRPVFESIGLAVVPEPAATALLGLAALGFLARRKR